MTREVRIGCVQTRPLATFDEAIEEARRLAGDAVAAGAELVCLPEYCGGLKSEGGLFAPPTAPEARHPVLDALRSFASDAGVWMLIGSIAVDGPGDRLINRGYVIDELGEVRARYDKIFLFDVDLSPTQRYRESAVVAPGGHAVLVDTPWGRLGMTICYDLRFPQLYRSLAQAGAEILAVPARLHQGNGGGTLARAEPCPRHRERRGGRGPVRGGRGAGRRRRLRPLPSSSRPGARCSPTAGTAWDTSSRRWTSRAWRAPAGASRALSTTGASALRNPPAGSPASRHDRAVRGPARTDSVRVAA